LPAARASKVARAARRAFHEHLPLEASAFTFAGVLQRVGNGTTDLIIAVGEHDDDPARLIELSYALLLRACAVAHERGDEITANACGDAIEALDDLAQAPAHIQ
jgi:hypothetical protein